MKRLMLVLVMVVSLIVGCDVEVSSEKVKRATEGTGLIDTNDPREALKIETSSCDADGWGFAKWKIKVKNNSISDWKDILIRVVYFGENGTAIYKSASDHTRYVFIPSGKSILIILNGTKCPEQAVSGSAKIIRATLCKYTLYKVDNEGGVK